MAYIGNVPADKYSTLSKQTITGDGGTAYTLDYAVATAQDIEVFVNNVRQEPGVAYTVSGTALTMTGAVSSSDDFYVVFQGKAVQTTTHPSGQNLQALDAQLTGDLKLETSSGGIYTVTGTDTSTNRTLTLPDEAGTVLTSASDLSGVTGVPNDATPIVFAYAPVQNPTLTQNAHTKNTYLTSEDIDTDGAFSSSRFTVPSGKGGKYWISTGMTYFTSSNDIRDGRVSIYKNGSMLKTSGYSFVMSGTGDLRHYSVETNGIFSLSVGDYIEQYYFGDSSGGTLSMNVDSSGLRTVYLAVMRLGE